MAKQFLIYGSQRKADDAQERMFQMLKDEAARQGYSSDANGIIGKRNGVDSPETTRTTAWAKPLQRKDGKFIVAHPDRDTVRRRVASDADIALIKTDPVLIAEAEEDDPRDGTWFDLEEITRQ